MIDPTLNEWKQADLGKETINTFYKNLPAIKQLKDKIDERISERGYLTGIDGRHLQIRSRHSALNQLLQSTGAITVKKATTILYDDLKELGLRWGAGLCIRRTRSRRNPITRAARICGGLQDPSYCFVQKVR